MLADIITINTTIKAIMTKTIIKLNAIRPVSSFLNMNDMAYTKTREENVEIIKFIQIYIA